MELNQLENVEFVLGKYIEDLANIDLAVVSPGVPLDIPFILNIKNNNIELIGEVELAYRAFSSTSKKPLLASITGTNGKTTTTSLTGELFKNAEKDTYIVGNIGNPIIDTVDSVTSESYMVSELSSFQLESISTFRPNVSAILNITEDHLNRHHTMENYIEAKARVFMNQENNDITILNYDNITTRELANKTKSTVYLFSTNCNLDSLNLKGAYIDDEGYIVINVNKSFRLMHKSEVSLPGIHNLQNCLASALIAYSFNIETSIIKHTLSTFKGVEHRQEFVKDLNNVRYVNDSKGTNPDSTIKAINSYERPIVLIAGGKDKKSDFRDLIEVAKGRVKAIVLLGETSEIIQKQARLCGFEGLMIRVNTMKDAVVVSNKISKEGDVVLLSPACASWDMYNNFEERGNEFKQCVLELESK